MDNNSANTSRIARNTLLLYVRMAIIMLVSLYTSRVVLNVLGVEDFGIYNVVSGIVILFSFLNTALTNASQRYLSVAIGAGDRKHFLKVFSTSCYLHVVLVLLFIIISETVGLWYVKEVLSVPEGKESLAVTTYHLAIISTSINIIRVPFQATIISYEHMSAYAYISIAEAFLKLIAVSILPIISGVKLILYSELLVGVYVCVLLCFMIYCIITYKIRLVSVSDKKLIKEFVSFSGWNIFGGVGDVAYQQGTNLIINFFCGVSVNAAVGIMNQVKTAVYSFVSNLQVAANPQIIKSYSLGNRDYFYYLVTLISRLSYALMLLFSIPMILNMDYILNLWLISAPEYASNFCMLILIFSLVDSLNGPLWVSMQASGKIASYQVVMSLLLLLNLPLSFYALKSGFAPEIVYLIQIFICIVSLVCRLYFAKKYCSIRIVAYLKDVVFPLLKVTLISILFPLLSAWLFEGMLKLGVTTVLSIMSVSLSMYWCGINIQERDSVKQKIFKVLKLNP